jgi:hypothetical protein
MSFDTKHLLTSMLVLSAALGGCAQPAGTVKGSSSDVCGWTNSRWRATVTRACSTMSLAAGEIGFCYDSPLVIEVEPMALSKPNSTIDLGICLASSNASIYIGTGGGNKTQLGSSGTVANAATYGFFSFIDPVPDGFVPCIGATAVTDGTYSAGTGFLSTSYYWKEGNNSTRVEDSFGTTTADGIAASGGTLTLPSPTLRYNGLTINSGLGTTISLPANTTFDHWPSPTLDGCP